MLLWIRLQSIIDVQLYSKTIPLDIIASSQIYTRIYSDTFPDTCYKSFPILSLVTSKHKQPWYRILSALFKVENKILFSS